MFADVCQRLDELPIGNELTYKLDSTIPDSLPYLADQFFMAGAEGWDFCLTEAEKRNIIRQAIQLKKLKGTIAGYRAIARIANARIPHYVAPPSIPYLGAKLTDGERLAFLSRYPTMRTYRFRTRGQQAGAMLRGCILKNNSGYGTTYPTARSKQYLVATDARERFQERAFIRYPNGEEKPLITYERTIQSIEGEATTYLTARIPGLAYGLFMGVPNSVDGVTFTEHKFAGKFSGKRFLVVHASAFRTFTVNFTEPYQYAQDGFVQSVQPSQHDPIDVHYKEVREKSIRRGMFLGTIFTTTAIHPITPVARIAPAISLTADIGRVLQSGSGATPAMDVTPQIGKGAQAATGEAATIGLRATLARVRGTTFLKDSATLSIVGSGQGVITNTNLNVSTGITPILNPSVGIGADIAIATRTGITPILSPVIGILRAKVSETGVTPTLNPIVGILRARAAETGATPLLNPTIGAGTKTAAASKTGITPILLPTIGTGTKIIFATKTGSTPKLNPAVGLGVWTAIESKTGLTPTLSPFVGIGAYSNASKRSGITPTLNPTIGTATRTAAASRTGIPPTLAPTIGTGAKVLGRILIFNGSQNSQYLGAI